MRLPNLHTAPVRHLITPPARRAKNSLPKCFITTNSAAKLLRGAVNRGEVLRTCFHLNFYTSIKSYILLKNLLKYMYTKYTMTNNDTVFNM